MEEISLDVLKIKPWWAYLEGNQQELLEESVMLLEREEQAGEPVFHDYAFVVFPAAKAYEGFLKKMFYDLELIGKADFEGDHFRIGRSLNPSLPERFRAVDWIFEKLSQKCQGENVPELLWETWKESRNLLFHWFPKNKNTITREEAKHRLVLIIQAIDASFESCRILV